MTDNYTEMIHMFENIVKVNRAVTHPFIEKKTGLKILDKGQDHGMIVTEADKKVSQYLLDGGIQGIHGIREQYPGSFSEEDDSPERLQATEIYQIDPIDGTGDFVDTYQSSQVKGPTTLVSKLTGDSKGHPFIPKVGLIFDVLNECALISDGNKIGLYTVTDNGKIKEVQYERTKHPWNNTQPIKINRRPSYPQLTFDSPFMDYLEKQGLNIERVNIGGAGTFALQFFRNYLQPKDKVRGFSELETLTIGFNAQPDWKTWDTDPTEVIANAIGTIPARTHIYGGPLTANACKPELKDMCHIKGYVMAPTKELKDQLTDHAKEFRDRNSDCDLLKKDYEYKNAIVAMKDK